MLVICLLAASFTGCLGSDDDSQIDFQPETRVELKTAVDEWIADSDSAKSTYGEISTWDTSLITNMSQLF